MSVFPLSVFGRSMDPGAPQKNIPRFCKLLRTAQRHCAGVAGAKFFDMAKNPIVCPKCGTVYPVASLVANGDAEFVQRLAAGACTVRGAGLEEHSQPQA